MGLVSEWVANIGGWEVGLSGRAVRMSERRRITMGERGAPHDPIRDIAYGEPLPSPDPTKEWLEQHAQPKLCSCGIELPRTGKCHDCD